MVKSISEVVQRQLCCGCGGCAYIAPERYQMADTLEMGRRPFLVSESQGSESEALQICPGIHLSHAQELSSKQLLPELTDGWGPVLAVWEGYAADQDIRFAGSSGGAATALSLFCLEKSGMKGVLHTAARQDIPYLNEAVISTSREELLSRTGSRYSSASPVEALDKVEQTEAACVFIGKPCDVAAVQHARKLRPQLKNKIGLTIAFFCAGVPSTKGVLALLEKEGIVDPASLMDLRFRGNGWPGLWTAGFKDKQGNRDVRQLTYAESWGFLQKYRQWRCYICPDHTGEFADISVGDPWYREVMPGEQGKSLIVARTQRGLDVIKEAVAQGYLVLEKEDSNLLPMSQPNLLGARGALWGRLFALRLFGVTVPKYHGFSTFRFWCTELSVKQKISSVVGTIRRIRQKQLNKVIQVERWSTGTGDKT